MQLPNLDPSGGHLSIREVLIEYDGPQLFVARNASGAIFLALHGPEEGKTDNWLYARVTGQRLSQLKAGAVSVRRMITDYAKGEIALVHYQDDGEPAFRFAEIDDVPESYLPDEESFLEPLQSSEIRPLPVPYAGARYWEDGMIDSDLPIPVEADLWEFDPLTIDYLKSHMTPLNIVAQRRSRLIADVVFSPGSGRTDFPVPSLGKVLISLQKTLDSLASDVALATPKGRPSSALKKLTLLDAIGTFPSSFGLRVEANKGSLADANLIDIAFGRFVDLLNSITDERALKEAFSQHTIDTKLYFGEVIKEISKTGSSVRISAGSPYTTLVSHASVSADQLADLASKIGQINEENDDEEDFSGRLRAVSLKTKFFLIENDDESRSGRIAEFALKDISGRPIDALYRARLRERRVLHELTGEISSKYTLESLEQIGPAERQKPNT